MYSCASTMHRTGANKMQKFKSRAGLPKCFLSPPHSQIVQYSEEGIEGGQCEDGKG